MWCRISDALLEGDEGTVPLVALLNISVPQAQPVFEGMLRNWFVVRDCQGDVSIPILQICLPCVHSHPLSQPRQPYTLGWTVSEHKICLLILSSRSNVGLLSMCDAVAVRVSAADRAGKFAPRNLVTRSGELFKADGEVVGPGGGRPGLQQYLLTSDAPDSAGFNSHIFSCTSIDLTRVYWGIHRFN